MLHHKRQLINKTVHTIEFICCGTENIKTLETEHWPGIYAIYFSQQSIPTSPDSFHFILQTCHFIQKATSSQKRLNTDEGKNLYMFLLHRH